jgi:hypothetical protein
MSLTSSLPLLFHYIDEAFMLQLQTMNSTPRFTGTVLRCYFSQKSSSDTQGSYLEVPAKVSKISASLSTYIQTFGAACVVKIYSDCFEE